MIQPICLSNENSLGAKIHKKIEERQNRHPMNDTRWMNQRIDDLQAQVSALIEVLNEILPSEKKK